MSWDEMRTPVGHPEPEDWGALIRRILARRGLTIGALAYQLGVSPKTIQKWIYENGQPSADAQVRVARAFDEAWHWLQAQVGRAPEERMRLVDEFIMRLRGTA